MKTTAIIISFSLLLGACGSMGADINGDGRRTLHDQGLADNGPPLVLTDRWNQRFATAYANEQSGRPTDGDLRRELFRSLIAESNAKCDNYLVGLVGVQNGYDTGLSLLALSATTASSVASPESSANLLGSLATFFTATRREVTNGVFGGKDVEILVQAVVLGRQIEEQRLFAQMNYGYFDRWDATSILSEVHAYDQKCGIGYGLQRLQESLVHVSRQAPAEIARELTNRAPPQTPDRTTSQPQPQPEPQAQPQPVGGEPG